MAAPQKEQKITTISGDKIQVVIGALTLLTVNLVAVRPLFSGEYTQVLGSIEPAFLTDARFIAENFPHLGWSPWWYGGFPFRLSYPPLLPFLIATLHNTFGFISIGTAYRILTGSFYALTAATLYLFTFYLTRRHVASIVATISYAFMPESWVGGGFSPVPWGLRVMVTYGEGPHIAGLALIPLSMVLFSRALRNPSPIRYLLASILISAVLLANVIAAMALLVILLIVFVSELSMGIVLLSKWKTAAICLLLTAGLTAFWYNPSFLEASAHFAGGSSSIVPVVLMTIGILVALFPVFYRKPHLQPVFIGVAWSSIFLVVVLAGHALGIILAPQPIRYLPEILMGASFLIGLASTSSYDWLTRTIERSMARRIFIVLGVSFLVSISVATFPSTWALTQPHRDFTETNEYRVADWLLKNGGDERIFATGSNAFWLNVFTDTGQIRGGSDQAAIRSTWWDNAVSLTLGGQPDLAILWLKALNVKYVVVDYPEAPIPYIEYSDPGKFEDVLLLRYSWQGTRIYEIPFKTLPVLVVDISRLDQIGSIQDQSDRERLLSYLEVVENMSGVPEFQYWNRGPEGVAVKAVLNSSLGILVKMNFDPGWRATVNGREVPVEPDPVGFILVKPKMEGEALVELFYGGTVDVRVGDLVSVATLIFIVIFFGLRVLRSSALMRIRLGRG